MSPRPSEAAIRSRVGMGPARWAEWLAFMEARGLEWGKALSEPPNAPAKALHPGWNIVQFPARGKLQQAKLTNSYIRARCTSLDRDWWSLWELLQELPGGADTFGRTSGRSNAGWTMFGISSSDCA